MRKILVSLGLLLATIFIFIQFNHFEKLVTVLQSGQLLWIAIAFFVQAIWQVAQAAQFRATHRLTNVRQSLAEILPVVAANNFILVAAPSANASTFALFIYDARQRGLSATRVLLAVLLFAVYQDLAHSLAVVAAFLVLIATRSFNFIIVLPAVILFLLTGLYTAAMALAAHSPEKILTLIVAGVRPLNRLAQRIRHHDLISETALRQFISESADDLRALRRQPLRLWLQAAGITLGSKLILGWLMATLFLSFHEPPTLPAIVVGVATASLLTVVSPTPLGIGVAESVTALMLTQMGVSAESALVISLAYRGLTVWLPMVYGFIALEWRSLRWYNAPQLATVEVTVDSD